MTTYTVWALRLLTIGAAMIAGFAAFVLSVMYRRLEWQARAWRASRV